jgi:hypothetical protein
LQGRPRSKLADRNLVLLPQDEHDSPLGTIDLDAVFLEHPVENTPRKLMDL